MTSIDIKKAHALDKEGIRSAAHDRLDRMRVPMGLDGFWRGDVYEFNKPTRGRVTIADGLVRVQIALGEGLHIAKGTIEKRIHAELDRLLKTIVFRRSGGVPRPEGEGGAGAGL